MPIPDDEMEMIRRVRSPYLQWFWNGHDGTSPPKRIPFAEKTSEYTVMSDKDRRFKDGRRHVDLKHSFFCIHV